MKVGGWNESLITYIMAASSPTHSIPKEVYTNGWARNGDMVNRRRFYNYDINLSPNWGGPLFWLHYTHLGINPHGLSDEYADYWQEHVNTAKIHYEYSIENPQNHTNYSDKCWGLTASDDPYGYTAHQPISNDNGTISPTAALASMPYTPEESLKALKYFYRERGAELFGKYGPYDAFNDDLNWVKESYIGIDQGPIVVMIENHRSSLLWNQVMKDADVQSGLDKLGFQYQTVTATNDIKLFKTLNLYPNPGLGNVFVSHTDIVNSEATVMKLYSMNGQLVRMKTWEHTGSEFSFDVSEMQNGLYLVLLINGDNYFQTKLLVHK